MSPQDAVAPQPPLGDTLERMAELLLSDQTLDMVLEMLANLATGSLPNVDAVGVTVVREGKVVTASFSHPIALEVDRTQYALGEGPCLTSLHDEVEIYVPQIDEDARWPAFQTHAEHAGIRSILSLPLDAKGRVIGALNLYSKTPRFFDGEQRDLARRFTRRASILLANACDYHDAVNLSDHLQEALKTRDVIGQAKGILMVTRNCSPEEAFDLLRRDSQERNVKLRDVAAAVVEEMRTPPAPLVDASSDD